MKVYFVLALFLLTTASCFSLGVGDGMFVVSGKIEPNIDQNEDCELSIRYIDSNEIRSWNKREINRWFRQDFSVNPRKKKYEIKIECDKKEIFSKIVEYPTDMGVGSKVDLGVIHIKK